MGHGTRTLIPTADEQFDDMGAEEITEWAFRCTECQALLEVDFVHDEETAFVSRCPNLLVIDHVGAF